MNTDTILMGDPTNVREFLSSMPRATLTTF